MLTNQGGFWIGATLILLIYFCLRSWWGKLCVLIVILLVVIGLCFVEFLSLFTYLGKTPTCADPLKIEYEDEFESTI